MKLFQPSESLTVGFLLALTGGLLDAYSYLNRGEVFATAETGNIVLMGINLAQQNWSGALHYLLPVLAFTAGILAAEWVRRRCDPGEGRPQRLHWRLPLLLAECVAILVVSALPMGPLDPLANIIISFASALQVESFRNIQGYGCVTTMCTGNLRSGTENLFHWLSRREPKAPPKIRVYYGLITCFILGAVVSGLASPLLAQRTALLACVPLLAVFFLLLRGARGDGASIPLPPSLEEHPNQRFPKPGETAVSSGLSAGKDGRTRICGRRASAALKREGRCGTIKCFILSEIPGRAEGRDRRAPGERNCKDRKRERCAYVPESAENT